MGPIEAIGALRGHVAHSEQAYLIGRTPLFLGAGFLIHHPAALLGWIHFTSLAVFFSGYERSSLIARRT